MNLIDISIAVSISILWSFIMIYIVGAVLRQEIRYLKMQAEGLEGIIRNLCVIGKN